MVVETLIVASTFRIVLSLPVLRWAFAGAIVALAADNLDKVVINLLDIGAMRHYQEWDKYLDQVYLSAFLVVAWQWGGLVRGVSVALFAFRTVGAAAFAATGERDTLIYFPNIFEFWFIAVAGIYHWRPKVVINGRITAAILALVIPLKLAQEWFLHQSRWLDQFTVSEFFEELWSPVADTF